MAEGLEDAANYDIFLLHSNSNQIPEMLKAFRTMSFTSWHSIAITLLHMRQNLELCTDLDGL